MPEIPPSKQNWFWTGFLLAFFLPLALASFSPAIFFIWLPVLGGASFIAYKIIFKTWPLFKTPVPGLVQLICFLIALMASSALWSVNPEASFERSLKASALIVTGFALLGVGQRCPTHVWRECAFLLPLLVWVIGFAALLNIHFGASDSLIETNSAVFTMALPLALYLSWKSRSVLLFTAILLLAMAMFILVPSQICQLVLLGILIAAFGSLSFLEKITRRTAFFVIAFLIFMMPWIAPTLFDFLATRMGHSTFALQVGNWDFLARKIIENPLIGFGMDSTRHMAFDTDTLYIHDNHIKQPHNLGLQFWIEFGVFGAAWVITFLSYLYVCLRQLSLARRRLAFLTFLSVIMFLMASWSIWTSWLLAFIFYLTALCVLAAKTSNDPLNS